MAAMFETQSFRDQIKDAVIVEAASRNLTEYETAAVDFLQREAANNERTLMETEVRKIASLRRGVPEALQSARVLAKLAADYAIADRRSVLRESDIRAALASKYCQVWPFCR
jgi:hypothetical protein